MIVYIKNNTDVFNREVLYIIKIKIRENVEMGRNMMDKLSIIIPAHDSHKDIVLLFWKCCERFWNDCPYKIFWTNCKEELQDTEIEIIHNRTDAMFSERLLTALSVVKNDYVLLWVEDFLPTKTIHTHDIEKVLEYMDEHQSNYCGLLRSTKRLMKRDTEESYIYHIRNNRPYGISINCGIFRRNYLISLIRNKNWSVWELESSLLKMAASGKIEKSIYLKDGIGNLVNYLFKGKIDPIAERKLTRSGVDLSFIKRERLPLKQLAHRSLISFGSWLCPVGCRKTMKQLASKFGIKIESEF